MLNVCDDKFERRLVNASHSLAEDQSLIACETSRMHFITHFICNFEKFGVIRK